MIPKEGNETMNSISYKIYLKRKKPLKDRSIFFNFLQICRNKRL